MKTTNPLITWENILNYKHVAPFTHNLCSFAKLAATTGYPYYSWNDRIYDTVSRLDTGVIVSDLDKEQRMETFSQPNVLRWDKNVVKLVTDQYIFDDHKKIMEFFDNQSPAGFYDMSGSMITSYPEIEKLDNLFERFFGSEDKDSKIDNDQFTLYIADGEPSEIFDLSDKIALSVGREMIQETFQPVIETEQELPTNHQLLSDIDESTTTEED